MMKRLTVLLLIELVGCIVLADYQTVGGYRWSYYIENGGAVIYDTDEDWDPCCAVSPYPNGAVTIPSTLGGKPVTRIGECAFAWCSGLTSLTIPDSVTSIDRNAFLSAGSSLFDTTTINGARIVNGWIIEIWDRSRPSGNLNLMGLRGIADGEGFKYCTNLTSVTISSKMVRIPAYAFSGCSRLTSITIPNSITSVGSNAFYNCSGLTSVQIADLAAWCRISFGNADANPLSRVHNLYVNGSLITDLVIPAGTTSIGTYAFSGCSGLTSVTIPNSVTSIGTSAFYGCNGLTSVQIADLTAWCSICFGDVGANPLNFAHNLYLNGSLITELMIPAGTTSIVSYAFSGCSGLTSVAIPNSVTSIGTYAFSGCRDLTSVTIPSSVTSIGTSAFYGCNGLTSVQIADLAAWCRMSLGNVEANPLNFAHNLYLNGSLITELMIPAGATSIRPYVFSGCSGLTSVTIPNSVTNIEFSVFFGCTNLVSMTLPFVGSQRGNSRMRSALFGYIFGSSSYPGGMQVVQEYSNPTTNSNYYGGNQVTYYRYSNYIPSSLKSVMITDETVIGYGAFSGCSGLTSVTIPASVTSIGQQAFSGCNGLNAVYVTDLMAWCGIVFGSADANPLYYAHRLYLNGGLVTDLTIPAGLSAIKDYAFYNCSSLLNVTVPDSITSIGRQAFYGCSGLKDAALPSRWALSSIFPTSYASITNVTVSSGTSGIANSAFKGCGALTSISIPDTVTRIGDEAFYNCTSLEHLTIPEGVTSYGVNCFEGCPAYTLQLYRSVFGGGSEPASTTIVQQVESPYALTDTAADRAIASVTVNSDCAIDSFVLKDGKVYDSVLYISNTAGQAVTLTLPSGYVYKAIKGARPLNIPANSQSILSITRVANNVFLVSREDLETIQ